MTTKSAKAPKEFPFDLAMSVLNDLANKLLTTRQRRFRKIGLVLLILGILSGAIGVNLQARGLTFWGEIFVGLAVEMGGALLTFWLIDYVWQGGEETHQAGVELSGRMMTLAFKSKKYNSLVREAYKEHREKGRVDITKAAEIIAFHEEIRADLNSALDFSVPYLREVTEEMREAMYQLDKIEKQESDEQRHKDETENSTI